MRFFDFRPGMLIRELGLKHPWMWNYQQTSTGGHFGRNIFPWEATDKSDLIRI